MNKNKLSEIDTGNNKEKLKITCIERKYKVEKSTISFIITARTELDEDATDKLLHEDMELKTFLTNYDITDIILFPESPIVDHIVETENVKKDSYENDNENHRNIFSELKIVMVKRRSLFDSLGLPEVFTCRNYTDAIEKNGMIITNIAMPYDDLKYFERKGKVIKLKKTERGPQMYKLVKNNESKIENKIFI